MHRNGFTMIEMVFVLSIVLTLSLLSFHFHPVQLNEQEELYLIQSAFNRAHAYVMAHKEKVTISIKRKELSISYADHNDKVKLSHGYSFITEHTFSYNNKGHIKRAKTIKLKTPTTTKQFIFQVGSGIYYVV